MFLKLQSWENLIQDNSDKYEISQFPCEDFPPDVCGGRRVELPHPASLTLTLIPADQGHVQSHLSTRNRNSYNPIFSRGQMDILCQMSQSHLRRNIFVCQTISHRDILDSKTCRKLSMTKTSVRLLENFAPRSVIAWQTDAENVISKPQTISCFTWHSGQSRSNNTIQVVCINLSENFSSRYLSYFVFRYKSFSSDNLISYKIPLTYIRLLMDGARRHKTRCVAHV